GLGLGGDLPMEQFAPNPAGRIVFGFGDGWNEQEYNPQTGKRWRWTSERATLRIRSERRPLLSTLAGETETFRKPSHIVVRAGDQILDEATVGDRFSLSVGIPAERLEGGETAIRI